MKELLASIDIGAHSARLLIVQYDRQTGLYDALDDLEIPVPLGADVFKTGKISNDSVQMLCGILKKFRQKLKEYRIENCRAIATSAVREAGNAEVFIERVKFLTGIDLQIFTGVDEARLGYLAAHSELPRDFGFEEKRLMLADIGTGACQVSKFDHGIMQFTETIKLGTLRAAEYLSETSSPGARIELLGPMIGGAFSELAYLSRKMECDALVVTGASPRALLAMRTSKQNKREAVELKGNEFRKLCREAENMTVDALGRKFNIKSDIAEAVLPCCMMISSLLKLTRAKQIHVLTISTKYSLIEDYIGSELNRTDPFEPQIFGIASQTAERYGCDMRLSASTAIIAEKLFHELQPLHGMSHHELILLKVAALLYKTGLFVSNQAYHKHSHYIILNTELPGLSLEDRKIVALAARYHRKSLPKPQHPEYMAVPAEKRAVVNKLAAILRLASGLAVACKPDERMKVRITPGLVTVKMGGASHPAALDYIDTGLFDYAFASKIIFV